MALIRLALLLYAIVVCPTREVVCQTTQAHGLKAKLLENVAREGHHHHNTEKPCDVCPRHGKCVPKVQCPAHVRPNSYNPVCHIGGQNGLVGVCCFTGSGHAAEADLASRADASISGEDIKSSHVKSQSKLHEWLDKAENLLEHSAHTVLNTTSPSFGHHLSVVTFDKMANMLGQGGLLNLFAAQDLKSRDALSSEDLHLGLTGHADGPFCISPTPCPAKLSRYRSIGGECNNADNPSWGAVHSGFERLLPPHYGDGVWSFRTNTIGLELPSARAVSYRLLLDSSIPSPTHNLMFMQLGQFITHDTTSGVMFTLGSNGSAISCCEGDGKNFLPPSLTHWACAAVSVPPDDDFYTSFGHKCLNFVRTQLAPSSYCTVGYANPMNGATHHIDLSQLYGNSEEKMKKLRSPGGLLNTFKDFGRELPPLATDNDCLSNEDGAACFESGDNNGNQIISLTVIHTLFTREHNRIVAALNRLNPDWSEDQLFHEARRLLQAQWQHIVYEEWLPLLLGPRIIQAFGLAPSPGYASSYDSHVNPAITAEFAAAAMRFGHSIVDSKFVIPDTKTGDVFEAIFIPEVMLQPSRLRLRPFLDRMIAGLTWQPMQCVDPFVSEGLTRYLFRGGNPFGLDLATINIQRGRDYGLRSYNEYRRLVGLEPFQDFRQFPPSAAQRLASVYDSPEDIDLWVGGLLEEPVDGGVLGPTFASIIADQFSRIKRGDRYFYENGPDVSPGAFTPSQLVEIKKASVARIICDNKDGIELAKMSPRAFLRSDLQGNEPVPCNSPLIPSLDLNRFKAV